MAVIAYGQTGAGKTHSMIGVLPTGPLAPCAIADDSSAAAHAGLAPRIFEALFEGLERQRSSGVRPVSAVSPPPLLLLMVGFVMDCEQPLLSRDGVPARRCTAGEEQSWLREDLRCWPVV